MQSTAIVAAESFLLQRCFSMSAPPSDTCLPPRCEICGVGTATVGKLPRIGLRPLLYVYKCDACNQITSIEPERQDEAAPASLR